jgi:hypothetical protein
MAGGSGILARVLRVKAATGGSLSRGGYGIPAETETGETPRITPLFRVGESSHGSSRQEAAGCLFSSR